jgi:hypothetical protein
MRNVVEIRSENGNFFRIGRNSDGYYLKNLFTEIPNEFGYYDISQVKRLFIDLCERIQESVPATDLNGHPNAYMRVFYDNNTQILYTQGEDGKNLCAYTSKAANFSEFYTGTFFGERSELITLEHLRQICTGKEEKLETFFKALKDYKEDDYTFLEMVDFPDGSISIDKSCYGVKAEGFVTISPEGFIGNDGDLAFVQLMKREGVKIRR